MSGILKNKTILISDNICIEDTPATAGSEILEGFLPPFSAEAVTRLIAAGAKIIRKKCAGEFTGGNIEVLNNVIASEATQSRKEDVKSLDCRVASLLAMTGQPPLAHRQPPIITLKPSAGLVSRHGLIALSSFDQIEITGTPADVALVLSVISGPDPKDMMCVKDAYSLTPPSTVHAPQEGSVRYKIAKKNGDSPPAPHSTLHTPHSHLAQSAYEILSAAEAASNLARYDGIRYGRRAEAFGDLNDIYELTRGQFFGDEIKQKIMLGNFVLSEKNYQKYYQKARLAREIIKKEVARIFEKYDGKIIYLAQPAEAEAVASLTGCALLRTPTRIILAENEEKAFTIAAEKMEN